MSAAAKLAGPRERPILFSGEMVRALLEGRKTQTRRVIPWVLGPSEEYEGWWGIQKRPGSATNWHVLPSKFPILARSDCPYGQPGDLLWVRETWADDGYGLAHYRADEPDWTVKAPNRGPWRSPIFMPRWASRITLEVTEVRVQRLQDISEEDALAEGMRLRKPRDISEDYGNAEYLIREFRELWNTIHTKRAHRWFTRGEDEDVRSPWVWALSFRRVTP